MVCGKESGYGEAFLAGNGVTAAQDDGEGIEVAPGNGASGLLMN